MTSQLPHYWRVIVALIIVGVVTLVASLAVEPDTGGARTVVPDETTGLARLVFYGPKGGITDLLGQPSIFVNGVEYARLVSGTYFYVSVPAGPVAACIGGPAHDCWTIDAVSGAVYYFEATYPYPLGYRLSPVDAAAGERERLKKASAPIPQRLINDTAAQTDLN